VKDNNSTSRELGHEKQIHRTKKYRVKKRALFAACYICLLVSFAFGITEVLSFKGARVSESENRMLQGFPTLSVSSIKSGTFMSEFEDYLSDAFYFRDEASAFSKQQLSMFSLPNDGLEGWDVDLEHLDAPVDDASAVPEEEPEATAEPVSVEVTPEPTAVPAPVEAAEPEEAEAEPLPEIIEEETVAETEELSGSSYSGVPSEVDASMVSDVSLYFIDNNGNRKDSYTISADRVAKFAQILNNYRAVLPEDGTVHFVIPPVSGAANNILRSNNYTEWATNLDEVLEPVVDDGIYIYDVPEILTPHIGETNLYPTDDHHWQPVSASLVADEMIKNQGIAPMNFYEYRYYIPALSHSTTYYGDAMRALKINVDTVPVMEPVSPVESSLLRQITDKYKDGVFIDRAKGSLLSYLGGLKYGPWQIFETGFHTGRTAIMVTDSFGLTLTPFLAPYYDRILYVDLRDSCFNLQDSGGTIRDYIEYYGADDLYMISSAYASDIVDTVQTRLFKYLG